VKIARYLPSRQFSFILGSLLIAGLIIYGASLLGKGKSLNSISLTPTETSRDIANLDTDKDALPDWEEGVRGTNPNKTDTDDDGTNDGDEVSAGRNPVKPSPDDNLVSEQETLMLQQLIAAASSSNLTDSVSKGIFAQYVASKQKGASATAQGDAVMNAIAKASLPLKGKIYKISDLNVVNLTDETSVRNFSNTMIRVLDAYPGARFPNVISMLTTSVDRGDARANVRLTQIGADYRSMARDLAKIPVPTQFSQNYLGLINSLENAGASLDDLSHLSDDPVRATAGLQNFTKMSSIGTNNLVQLTLIIMKTGIKFGRAEPGYALGEYLNTLAARANGI